MRDLGTPDDRFRRAVNAGNLAIAEGAMREMGPQAGLGDALELLGLMAAVADARYDRAAARWVALVAEQRELALEDTRALLAMVELLPGTPELIGVLREHVPER